MSPVLSLQPVSEGAKRRFLERGQTDELPPNIRRCWQRVRPAVDATGRGPAPVLEGGQVQERAHRLDRWLPLLPEALESVHRILARRDHVVVFADSDAVVLHQSARSAIADAAREAGIVPGSVWNEEIKGTNAIGTALVEERAIAVHGAAHFAHAFHDFTCYAALVHDLRGELLGVIDATTVTGRRVPEGWRAVATAVADWEQKVRARAGPADHLLPWDQLQRIVSRFSGSSVVFGARGALRLCLPGEGMQGAMPDLVEAWPQVKKAVGRGESRLLGPSHTLHLEPFHAPDGRLLEVIVHAEPKRAPRRVDPGEEAPSSDGLDRLAGQDPAQRAACARARRLAGTGLPIALLSETGTGKELLARAIHRMSPQRGGPFVALNCAALPAGLVESELFGHAPGAFTGASPGGQDGWLAAADGGTLFLDEVADLPGHVQLALLRFLEDGSYARLGERAGRRAKVRIIAATSQDLLRLTREGGVRVDFFYRICAASVTLPPLRNREDRVELAEEILESLARAAARPRTRLSPGARARIAAGAWPGNIRQLKHALQVAMALCEDDEISAEDIPSLDLENAPTEPGEGEDMPVLSEARVREALIRNDGKVSAAARELAVARSTIYRWLRRRGLSVKQLLTPSDEARPDEPCR